MAAAVGAAFFLLVVAMLLRSRHRPVITGGEALIDVEGEVVDWGATAGWVRVNGEVWQARNPHTLRPGVHIARRSRTLAAGESDQCLG